MENEKKNTNRPEKYQVKEDLIIKLLQFVKSKEKENSNNGTKKD